VTEVDTDPVLPHRATRRFSGRLPAGWIRPGSTEALVVVLIVAILARGALVDLASSAWAQTLLTVFLAVLLPALPFVVLGTLVSGAVVAFVPASLLERALARPPLAAVPMAGAAGIVLPSSDCAPVPPAAALVRRGVLPAAALTFMLASPAVNPIVLVATAIAFPGEPAMVAARFAASLLVAVALGLLWLRLGRPEWLAPQPVRSRRGWPGFWSSSRRDLVRSGGFLVIGAFAAAVLQVALPAAWLQTIGRNAWFSVVALALLAVLLSVSPGADAFVAASLTQFSLTARLAFLVVGPMLDLRLLSTQAATLGPRFAVRFAPATVLVALLVSALVGWVLL
jgi:uncharacterized membrane protein YraQ (UPF0718 family)